MSGREELFTIGEVARTVGMPRWQVAYLVERGDLPGPTIVVPGRRLFTAKDVDLIRARLAERQRISHMVMRPKGSEK